MPVFESELKPAAENFDEALSAGDSRAVNLDPFQPISDVVYAIYELRFEHNYMFLEV